MLFPLSRYFAAMVAAGTILAVAAPAAATTTFKASLAGDYETVPNTSPGFGNGVFTLSTDRNSFGVVLTFGDLTGSTRFGHLHCCAAQGGNASVAVPFTFATGTTSGSINQVFDLSAASTYTSGFVTAHGGTVALARSAFLAGLDGGLVYANIHTTSFPGGEIRGQVAAAPEPGTWSMMISGFGLVGGAVRRRRVVAA